MKEYLRAIIEKSESVDGKRLLVREYLQARTLEILQDDGAFENWAFVGGTALRFLYNLPRFSEDLDFSLKEPFGNDKFTEHLRRLLSIFKSEGYETEIKAKPDKTVKSAFLKFPGLLKELNLSPMLSEVISIKIEIDTNPPDGAHLETTVINRYTLVNILHHDKPTLFGGKIRAILTRRYPKGRDFYDLFWYLAQNEKLVPNLLFLNNALSQGGESSVKDLKCDMLNWKNYIAEKVESTPWETVLSDIAPFLENQRELALLTKSNMLKLLSEV